MTTISKMMPEMICLNEEFKLVEPNQQMGEQRTLFILESERINYEGNLSKRRKSSWTKHDDEYLSLLVRMHGSAKWPFIAKHIKNRNAKQCRERWFNTLNPDINKNPWTEEEDNMLIQLYSAIGNKWAQMSQHFTGRTDNAIKNRYNGLKRRKKLSSVTKQNGEITSSNSITPKDTKNDRQNQSSLNSKDSPSFEQFTPPKSTIDINSPNFISDWYDANGLNEYAYDTKFTNLSDTSDPLSDEFQINNTTPIFSQPGIKTPRTPTPYKNFFDNMNRLKTVKCNINENCDKSKKPSYVKKIDFESPGMEISSSSWDKNAVGQSADQELLTNLAQQYLSSF